jgi:hypothetical protein
MISYEVSWEDLLDILDKGRSSTDKVQTKRLANWKTNKKETVITIYYNYFGDLYCASQNIEDWDTNTLAEFVNKVLPKVNSKEILSLILDKNK